MATRIDTFRSELTGGGARPSQFRVTLNFPSWVTYGAKAGAKAQFMVNAASLPSSSIQPIEVPFRGRFTKVPGERMFQPWTIKVLNDMDFQLRNAFEEWSHGILNNDSIGGRVGSSDGRGAKGYAVDLVVDQLNRNDQAIQSYRFVSCYPQDISEIQLDFGATNTIEEFQVTFALDYWTSNITRS